MFSSKYYRQIRRLETLRTASASSLSPGPAAELMQHTFAPDLRVSGQHFWQHKVDILTTSGDVSELDTALGTLISYDRTNTEAYICRS